MEIDLICLYCRFTGSFCAAHSDMEKESKQNIFCVFGRTIEATIASKNVLSF